MCASSAATPLTALPDAVTVVWPRATVALCVVHLIRASLRYASKKDWTPLTQCLRPIYTAVDETTAAAALDALEVRWEPLPGDRAALAGPVGAVRTVPGVPPGGPPGHRHDQPDRVDERPTRRRRPATAGSSRPSRPPAKVLYLAVRNLQDYRRPTVGIRSSGWEQALQGFTIYIEGRLPTE